MTHIPAQPSVSSAIKREDSMKAEIESSAKAKTNIEAIDNKSKVAATPIAPTSSNAVDIDA
jgi:hypothetical protein